MSRLNSIHLAVAITLAALGAVAIAYATGGGQMFSPGELNAQSRGEAPLGGVSSHAEIAGNCAACHAPPWSDEPQSLRCLSCHTEVDRQIDAQRPLHGMIAGAGECRSCHTEHQGPHGALTDMARFDHDWTAFPLTGSHVGVQCGKCHRGESYQGVATDCAACHAEPQIHLGRFGTRCGECHSTATFENGKFEHSFPLNHGGGPKNKQKACAMCHEPAANFTTYTCYVCHRHDPLKTQEKHARRGLVEIQDCAGCHPNGRRPRGERREDDDLALGLEGTLDGCAAGDVHVAAGGSSGDSYFSNWRPAAECWQP
jgi:hypothetical protein